MASEDLTALVVLRAASGKRTAADAPITAKNIGDFLPSPEGLQTALTAFERGGFHAGTRVGNTFSISASKETFETLFGTKIDPNKTANLDLPVPPQLAPMVEAVTFEAPRELH